MRASWISLVVAVLLTAAGAGGQALDPAGCEPAEDLEMSGELGGSAWKVTVEQDDGLTLLAVRIAGEDSGAVEAVDDGSTWYYTEGESVIVMTGGLPSKTTYAVAILEDGSELAMCPFGDSELAVAAGVVDSSEQVASLQLRRGSGVVAEGHVAEARHLADGGGFAFAVLAPGAVAYQGGAVRSPGVELTFDDTVP